MNAVGAAYRAGLRVSLGDLLGLAPGAAPLLRDRFATPLRRVNNDGSRDHVVVIEAALGRRGLMDMLYALAPYKAHGPDRFSRVLDNWAIFDRAKGNGASNSLFMQHVASLGANWQTFGEHREVFVSVLTDGSEGTRVVPLVCWQTTADGRRRWKLDVEVDAGEVPFLHTAAPGATCDALAGLISTVYLQPALAKGWPAWKPLVKGGKSNYIGPASVPMMALLHRRVILNSRFVRAIEALDYDQERFHG
jgi:hypothetical protein